MNESDTAAWGAILIILVMFLLPIIWIVALYPAEPYHAVSGEPLRDAAQAAGIKVVSATDSTWPVAGATGGKPIPCRTKKGIFTPFRLSCSIVPGPGMLPSRYLMHNRLGGAGLPGNLSLSGTICSM